MTFQACFVKSLVPVLEPYFDLPLGEAKGVSDLYTAPRKIKNE